MEFLLILQRINFQKKLGGTKKFPICSLLLIVCSLLYVIWGGNDGCCAQAALSRIESFDGKFSGPAVLILTSFS
ncbi:MAG: hypothetical protein IPM04_19570 [Saprospiraceae bacterium]|nr:hypothetical protein [Candidatus Brachybacter algidus]MBK8749935.1 hypothetical protein [Candidatus Brachybacter algidus]